MTDKKEIITFLGLKTSGKDYRSYPYITYGGYIKKAFADPLREVLWGIMGYTPESYAEFKKEELVVNKRKKILGFIPSVKEIKITTIRKMLQNTGSVFKKLFGENYWTNLWYKDLLETGGDNNIVVTDARFTYELKKILSLKKKGYRLRFVYCMYEGANYDELLADEHESEKLAQYMYTYREKYSLSDGKEIAETMIRRIVKDYEEFINGDVLKNLNK